MHHKIGMNGDRKWPSWGAIVFVAFVAAFIALALSAGCTGSEMEGKTQWRG